MVLGGCCKVFRARNVLIFISSLLMIFGIVIIAIGAYSLATYAQATEAILSQSTWVFLVVCGILTIPVFFISCYGAEDPKTHPQYIFIYWLLVTAILLMSALGFFFFRRFVLGIETTVDSTSTQVFSVVQTELEKELNDFILSTYTACCTGCDITIGQLNCVTDSAVDAFSGEEFCSSVKTKDDVTAAQCTYAEQCRAEDLSADNRNGFGLGCYMTTNPVPSFPVGVDTCSVMQQFTVDKLPLVGSAGNGFSCGGGSPKVYLENFFTYFNNRYFLIAVPWGFLLALLTLAWIASVYMICFRKWIGDRNDEIKADM